MKKLNLFLIPVLFSSLLNGCGMPGPLYRVPEVQPIEKTTITPEKEVEVEKQTTEMENTDLL